jgi:hypothetical protein
MSTDDQRPPVRLIAALGRTSTVTGGIGGSTERLDLLERRLRAYIELPSRTGNSDDA